VIVNTIRIAVHARRDEIEIMQLVGATDWFVSWPFILEGILVGTFGAVVALAVLALASGPVTSAMVGFLDILPVSLGANFVIELAAGVLAFAVLVGGFGASLSVRSQLAKGAHA
jgi:cell division transport system permease protein